MNGFVVLHVILSSITTVLKKILKKSKIKDSNHPTSLCLLYTDLLLGHMLHNGLDMLTRCPTYLFLKLYLLNKINIYLSTDLGMKIFKSNNQGIEAC